MAFETLARILQRGHFDQTDVEQHFFPLLRTDFSRSFITQVPHRLPQMCLPHLPAADPAAWEQISFLPLWVWAIEVTLHHLARLFWREMNRSEFVSSRASGRLCIDKKYFMWVQQRLTSLQAFLWNSINVCLTGGDSRLHRSCLKNQSSSVSYFRFFFQLFCCRQLTFPHKARFFFPPWSTDFHIHEIFAASHPSQSRLSSGTMCKGRLRIDGSGGPKTKWSV